MPGFFSNTLAVLRREIHRVARQPMYWLLTVILPIVAFAFFAVLLYKGVARDIPIAVVDQDNSTLSRKVTQMIDATPTAWVAYGVQGMEEAERLMLQGKIMGIVLIPDFFEKNILNNSQTHLESYLTGTNITVNGLLAKDLQTTVTTFTAGIQLQLLMKQGLTEKQAMAQLMPVRFDKHVLFNPTITTMKAPSAPKKSMRTLPLPKIWRCWAAITGKNTPTIWASARLWTRIWGGW